MNKFGFVVLQYNNHLDTIECVESLLKQTTSEFMIVVVDNCSTTNAFEIIEKKYREQRAVAVIRTNRNLGFSKGNNVGIAVAREKGAVDIAVINNDTVIHDRQFIEKYYQLERSDTYIISPRIISAIDGNDQNPFMVTNHFIKNKQMAIRLALIGLVKYFFILLGTKEFWEKRNVGRDYTLGLAVRELKSETDDYMFHGAAFILTEKFNQQFDKIPDLTFMYEEETLLYIVLRQLGLQYVYTPKLVIHHKEQASTTATYANKRKKLIFGYREDCKARMQVLKVSFYLNDQQYLSKLLKSKQTKTKEAETELWGLEND
ncbi:glycosyltransferase [Enterococcus xiangfangensis]|uniref:glycosyltransferase n=1 Tax=Enterococcus xiangfangensis TaxID=1296537 RepID=UPI0010F50A5B|nr:glycosyltransferase [Enterococcus xiangfangensis]MBM7710852.1 GT2 family glycosyltransferase [Enterococcus xiangfangensis]